MSVEQTDTIDFISTAPDGHIVLTVSDHLSWEESNHLALLQDKINSYLQFIESGQILEEYPAANDNPLVIQVTLKHEPIEEAVAFLNRAKKAITEAGINFQWKVVNEQ